MNTDKNSGKNCIIDNLYTYRNVSQFLIDFYNKEKELNSSFSYQKWGDLLDYPNRSYLRFMVIGKRPLSKEVTQKLINYFSFTNDQQVFFKCLVEHSQAGDDEERKHTLSKLESNLFRNNQNEIQDYYEFLSDDLLPILQTLFSFSDTPDNKQLAAILDQDEKTIELAINKLEQLQLIINRKAKKRDWTVRSSAHSPAHDKFYKNSFKRAEKSIEQPFETRKFRSLFVAMNPSEFESFLEDFEVYIKETLQKRSTEELDERRLYQLCFQFFPVTLAHSKKSR